MTIYKLTISYDGTDFYGWQKQPNVISVQEKLESCLKKIIKQDGVRTMASGRTDAGVHARRQVVKLEMPFELEPARLIRALNQNLPCSIRVRSVEQVEDFHPTREVKVKTYRYYFSKEVLSPTNKRFILQVDKEIDLERMQAGAKLFIGQHSFHNYFCVGTPVNSYIREIFSCSIVKEKCRDTYGDESEVYYLEISGSGFLKQMVRLIFGALHSLSQGKVTLSEIETSLSEESSSKVSPVAPPEGLVLFDVTY